MLLKHCTGIPVNRKSWKDQRQPSSSPPIRTRNSFSHGWQAAVLFEGHDKNAAKFVRKLSCCARQALKLVIGARRRIFPLFHFSIGIVSRIENAALRSWSWGHSGISVADWLYFTIEAFSYAYPVIEKRPFSCLWPQRRSRITNRKLNRK